MKKKLQVIICSCLGYHSDRRRRSVDAQGCAVKREALRKTWLSRRPEGVNYTFFVGAPAAPEGENDVWALDAPDNYTGLSKKIRAALARSLEDETWDWLCKCCDDSYIVLPRLLAALDELKEGGPVIFSGVGEVPGIAFGSCYVMPRALVQAVVDDPLYDETVAWEDVQVTRAALRAGARLVNDDRLRVFADPYPTPANNQICCHWCLPQDLYRIHAAFASADNALKSTPSSFLGPHVVHQYWAYGEMSDKLKAWCASVRGWAERRGWKYRLWTQKDLEATFAGEEGTRVLARCREVLPTTTTDGFASDWWRFRLLAEYGGIWRDTDYIVQNEAKLNAWEPKADVALMAEGWRSDYASIGCVWCVGERGHEAAKVMHKAATEALSRLLPLSAPDFAMRYIQIARRDNNPSGIARAGIGPWRTREEFLPKMTEAGFTFEVMPLNVCCDRRLSLRTALLHVGNASWAEKEVDWQKRERQAQAADFIASRPSWQSAQCRATASKGARKNKTAARRAQIADGLRVPSTAKRIVIFSNIPGFNPARAGIRDGDFCIHCNRSVHFNATKAISGTIHACLVRHGKNKKTGGWCWYDPDTTNDMRQIIHIDDAGMSSRRQWWRAYRAATGKAPTTGFIAWHLAREAVGDSLPIILAGFAPGEQRGTYLWDGHAWNYEAEVYRKSGAAIIAP